MFERGFKTWCETCAVLQRKRLKLRSTDPLDPNRLAQVLGVAIHTAADVPSLGPAVLSALRNDSDSWSAVTISDGTHHVIVINPWHSAARTSSDTMHELAHVLRGHSPTTVDVTEDGGLMLQSYDKIQEAEADWLAGCLLLPRDALLHIKSEWQDLAAGARHYGVSVDLLRMRINVTGVEYQYRRARGRRSSG
jgi:Zn-dependent peptidase ImmA (M78 family)